MTEVNGMKKVLNIIICVLMILSAVNINNIKVYAGENKSGTYTYEVLSDKTVKITKYNADEETVNIPAELDGKAVTSIGEYAFFELEKTKKIIVSEGVTKIEDWAISMCPSLESVSLPESLTIVNDIFEESAAIKEITIGKNVKSISAKTFKPTAFYRDERNWDKGVLYLNRCLISVKTSYTGNLSIKDNILTIAEDAFKDTSNVKKVTFPKSLKYINAFSFYNCKSISAFKVVSENAKFSAANGVLFNKNKSTLIAYPSGLKVAEYSLPKSVKTVSKYAFMNSKLKKIVLDKNLNTIGDCAFFNCKKLKSITIPKSVKKIGYESFGYYESGEEFDVDFLIKGFELKGYQGSEAQKYCLKNEIDFAAVDYAAPIVSVKGGNKKISVKYKKVKGAKGYQIRYTANGKSKTKTFKSGKATTRTLKKLKKGNYSVRVRAYTESGKQTIYSKWSKAKTIKVK